MTYVIVNGAIIALIWTGAIRVDMGILTQGAVVALYNYMAQILTELIKLANLIINITKSIACGNRIQSVLEVEPSVTDSGTETAGEKGAPRGETEAGETGATGRREKPGPGTVCVEFQDACLRYPQASDEALTGISFTASAGETIGVIGGTGSGKTSLVNLIPRFYDCSRAGCWWTGGTSGNIRWENCGEKSALFRRKRCCLRGRSARTCSGEKRMLKRRKCCGRSGWRRRKTS